ncbi:MAG TPA: hypothetical protein VEH09_13760 [Thermodesulfobacteriota bacterium]|nr:hypothetical protein [Thermodesulfobacteriota bacterium]
MDQRLRAILRARIRRIHDELLKRTIYVTYDQEEAVALSDKIVIMDLFP